MVRKDFTDLQKRDWLIQEISDMTLNRGSSEDDIATTLDCFMLEEFNLEIDPECDRSTLEIAAKCTKLFDEAADGGADMLEKLRALHKKNEEKR